ncbi:hypothetical protein GTA08_BOTSDO02611 [Botryosphaeria dothidea]|uniref:Uncharacterized protein n=1 Tax=Botryosphaeria dothidea TaxID=55169 RepID=A0A8H4IY43_9PEZI|nr:hypothetical protein GTA08_BOTSDO02611 [Botryosphaeria dothidea]
MYRDWDDQTHKHYAREHSKPYPSESDGNYTTSRTRASTNREHSRSFPSDSGHTWTVSRFSNASSSSSVFFSVFLPHHQPSQLSSPESKNTPAASRRGVPHCKPHSSESDDNPESVSPESDGIYTEFGAGVPTHHEHFPEPYSSESDDACIAPRARASLDW